MSRLIALLVAITIPFIATACSGGGGETAAPTNAAPAPSAPADQEYDKLVAPDGWKIIQPVGLKGKFALPEPTASNAQEGVQTFVGGQGTKPEIYVSVYSRGGAQIGKDEGDALAVFEKSRLEQQTTRLMEKGFKPEIKYEKEVGFDKILGQQIKTDLGKQFIFNQFYVSPDAFYHIKIDNADESNPNVQQFVKLFQP